MRILFLGAMLCATLLAMHDARADAFDDAAVKYAVPVQVLRAIAAVESSNRHSGIIKHNKNGTVDYGIMQINSIHYNTTCKDLDVLKRRDNIMCGARILASHKRHSKTDPIWHARYHSKTPSKKSRYAKKLEKALQVQRAYASVKEKEN